MGSRLVRRQKAIPTRISRINADSARDTSWKKEWADELGANELSRIGRRRLLRLRGKAQRGKLKAKVHEAMTGKACEPRRTLEGFHVWRFCHGRICGDPAHRCNTSKIPARFGEDSDVG